MTQRPAVAPCVFYQDPVAAMKWLEAAFGFETTDLVADAEGKGGAGTQFMRITLPEGLDAHCEHARAAGARITDEPADQFYGARTYRAMDPEGHIWNFTEEVRVVSTEEMERASGLTFATALPETTHG